MTGCQNSLSSPSSRKKGIAFQRRGPIGPIAIHGFVKKRRGKGTEKEKKRERKKEKGKQKAKAKERKRKRKRKRKGEGNEKGKERKRTGNGCFKILEIRKIVRKRREHRNSAAYSFVGRQLGSTCKPPIFGPHMGDTYLDESHTTDMILPKYLGLVWCCPQYFFGKKKHNPKWSAFGFLRHRNKPTPTGWELPNRLEELEEAQGPQGLGPRTSRTRTVEFCGGLIFQRIGDKPSSRLDN